MQEVRWGIIGCGDVTEVKSGPGFQKAANSRLVAVMRRNGEMAKDYAIRHGVPKWYDNADELINDPEVDAVYIATPPAYHKEYVLKVAKAGKPMYVEKPMALTFNDCQEMLEACQSSSARLYVAYYRRSLPRFLKIKELLESNVIGDVRFVQVTHCCKPTEADAGNEKQPWRTDAAIAGGGYFYDLGCHTLDLLEFLLGPITKAYGHSSNQGGYYASEDIVSGCFTFEAGIHGTGLWCFTAFKEIEQNLIVGTKGEIIYSTFANEPIRIITAKGEEKILIDHPPHVQQPLIEDVVGELLGNKKCPSTGITGARANWIMERLISS